MLAVRGVERTIEEQIENQIDRNHPFDTIEYVLEDIATLADIPGARRRAIELLVRFALKVWHMTLHHDYGLDPGIHKDTEEIESIEDVLVEMLNTEMAAPNLTPSDQIWDFHVMKQIRAGRRELARQWEDFWDHEKYIGFFPRSLKFLYERHSRRVADLLATRVASRLPPELIKRVRDGIHENGSVLA